MTLSSACQYVIRAMVFLSSKSEDVPIKDISKELDIPYHFLSKNMQKVVKSGLVESKRGVDGGVKLALSPKDINIMDIIKSIDSDKYFDKCILGIDNCDGKHPCALHKEWGKRKDEFIAILSTTSLEDVIKDFVSHKIARM